jgi:C-terminal processing protease CtpA/Prc
VYVLIGINTFSAAADLAAAFQDYGLATLVGEETGGLASSHGDSYTAILPHTRLRLDVSTKFYVRPSGVAGGGGVVPDVHIAAGTEWTLDDDPAIRWILRNLAGELTPH